MLNFASFQFDIRDNLANEYGGAIYIDTLFSTLYKGQCYWLLYFHDEFCSDIYYSINNCTIPIVTNSFCKKFKTSKIRYSEATSHINITNNTALLAGSAVFYSNVQSIDLLYRSANLLDPVSIFNIPNILTITPNVTEPLVMATQP